MKTREIIIIGCGGHAKVAVETIERQNLYQIKGLIDQNPQKSYFFEYKILGNEADLIEIYRDNTNIYLFIAIGDNKIRLSVFKKIKNYCPQVKYATVIHPTAILSRNSTIGEGSILMAQSSVGVDSEIGEHCIINTNATVEHDCYIGDFSGISPKVALAGGVKVNKNVLIGVSACVIPNCEIGANSIIGAGSVVTKSIPSNVTAVGIPARVIREHEENIDVCVN